MNVIEIDHLTKSFRGKRGKRVEALKDVCLSVQAGEVFGFLGPNGAGKSTTIKTLMGLVKPTSGSARLCGLPVTDSKARANVGYLPENPSFYDYLSAQEYLSYIGRIFGMSPAVITSESERVLERLGLSDAARRPIRGYSKGMVQRVGLAQAMLHDPDVYILDEPMSGLDPLGRSLVKDVIKELKTAGKTVFFSTHITADIEAVCDRFGIIVQGRIEAIETVRDVIASDIISYLVEWIAAPPQLVAEVGHPAVCNNSHVPREGIADFIATVKAEGGDILAIEPQRGDLESFFLKVIRKDRNDSQS